MRFIAFLLVAIAGSLVPLTVLAAPQETVLSALGSIAGGNSMASLIMDSQGALYGTTCNDIGQNTCGGSGSVFKLSPPQTGQTAWIPTILHHFGTGSDGVEPMGRLLMDSKGVLYGTTYGGYSKCPSATALDGVKVLNPYCGGTVFKLAPPSAENGAWRETVLHHLSGADGAGPVAGLIADSKGDLFGTTENGGSFAGPCANSGCGVVFELKPPAAGHTVWSEQVLHRFDGNDGAAPMADLVMDSGGALYGTTSQGGDELPCLGGCGVVFKLNPPKPGHTVWTEQVLHRFAGHEGAKPTAGLLADGTGRFYGTTQSGGSMNAGTVFSLAPPTPGHTVWGHRLLYSFKGGLDGEYPASALIMDARGVLYGTTFLGGISDCPAGGCNGGIIIITGPEVGGTVFKLTPPPAGRTIWAETVLYRFVDPVNGNWPYGGLIMDAKGTLYGATELGGVETDWGGTTVYELVQ